MWAYSYITTSDWSGGELLIPQILRGFPQALRSGARNKSRPRQPAVGAL